MSIVRVIAPIWSFESQFCVETHRQEYQNAKELLEKEGFSITLPSRFDESKLLNPPPLAFPPYYDTLENRLNDFEEAISDPCVEIIMFLTGGVNGEDILPALPYEKILSCGSKIIVGHSQATQILNTIATRCKTRCIYGVNFLDLGDGPEYASETAMTLEAMMQTLRDPYKGSFVIGNNHLEWIVAGCAEGILVGGELEALIERPLAYQPDLEGKVLMIEPANARDPVKFSEKFELLKNFNGHENLSGLLLSYFPEFDDQIRRYLVDSWAGIPVVFGCSSGHFRPRTSLDLGLKVQFSNHGSPHVRFLSS